MTKMLDPIEEAQRALRDEIAMLREVNRAQADNYTSLARQLADREEQLRKAQERIRAAEAERDRAWNEAIEAAVRVIENGLAQGRGVAGAEGLEMVVAAAEFIAEDIRSLAKEAGE
jgi:Skp family chaperone for outer membrane proteins